MQGGGSGSMRVRPWGWVGESEGLRGVASLREIEIYIYIYICFFFFFFFDRDAIYILFFF